jgi:hypothetical protein
VLTVAAGCGGSSKQPSAASSGQEAVQAAAGDIPDNQVFLTYGGGGAGYRLKYPEGWSRSGGGKRVAFTDKDNSVRLVIGSGRLPTTVAAVAALRSATPEASAVRAHRVSLPHGPALKITYQRRGPPDSVTGKRPLLLVDRYVYARGGRTATLDLASPRGVDNVDAYRLISRSFAWA